MPTLLTPIIYALSTLASTIFVDEAPAAESRDEPVESESINEPDRCSMCPPQPQHDPSMPAKSTNDEPAKSTDLDETSDDEPVVSIDVSMDEPDRGSMWMPQPQHDPSAADESTDEPVVSTVRSAFNDAITEYQRFCARRFADSEGLLFDNDGDSYYSPTILQEPYSCFRSPSPDPDNQYNEADVNMMDELGNIIQDCSHIINDNSDCDSHNRQEKADAPIPTPIARQPMIIAVSKARFVALSNSSTRPKAEPPPPRQPVYNKWGVPIEEKLVEFNPLVDAAKSKPAYKHKMKKAPHKVKKAPKDIPRKVPKLKQTPKPLPKRVPKPLPTNVVPAKKMPKNLWPVIPISSPESPDAFGILTIHGSVAGCIRH